jgi:hypothetical protein
MTHNADISLSNLNGDNKKLPRCSMRTNASWTLFYVHFNDEKNNKNIFIFSALKCYVFASFVCCCPVITVTVEEEDVSVVCVIKFEFELLLLHRIEYTDSTLLSFSNRGIKSSSSESVVSSNQDLTGT